MGQTDRDLGALLERGAELDGITALLAQACGGRGAVALVEGPAGIGKSALLAAGAERARELGMQALRARGDDVSMESSFAAVRELLWTAGTQGTDAARGSARLAAPVFEAEGSELGEDADRAVAVLHGLYWLVADLADSGPLALFVDDAHWLDRASARFLVYLARRIESLPVLLVVAVRRGEVRGEPASLAEQAAVVLRPAPLSVAASGVLVRRELGPRADDELCRSCHVATGGNPFYLRELVTDLKSEGRRPTVDVARSVRSLGAGTIGRSVLVRIGRLGLECDRLAQALAILGPGAPLRHAARLAELERAAAELAADRLRAADVLAPERPLDFVHPIVHEALLAELPVAGKAALHSRAAALLADEGAPADRVAAHLLSAEPFGESWVVEALRTAARQAMARGAPDTAAGYLRRALAEPPAAESRLEVLLELGRAEALLPVSHEFRSLREALELAREPEHRARVAQELAWALLSVGRGASVRALVEEALRDRERLDAELVQRLEAHLLGGGASDLSATRRILSRSAPWFVRAARNEVDDPLMLAALASTGVVTGLRASEASGLARRALYDERLLEHLTAYNGAARVLTWADQLANASAAQEIGLVEAQRRGSAPLFMHASTVCSVTALRLGELDLAADHAQRAHEISREIGSEAFAVMFLIPVLAERGRIEEARAIVDTFALDEGELQLWQGVTILAERGRLRIAAGELEAGVSDMLEADRRMAAARCDLSVIMDWTPSAAGALARLGREGEAARLAERELQAAVAFGASRRKAIALSLRGTIDRGPQGLAQLREAVRLLENSPARLTRASVLVNLGTGLRHRGDALAAREPLAEGLDLAHQCGGVAVAETARAELVAAGARPRRASLRGPGALTPAELRTARMAAGGMSNREVAQALFVSTKTVETQLSQAYAKLQIRSRGELAVALATGTPAPDTRPQPGPAAPSPVGPAGQPQPLPDALA
jgi:DNA-binding CsgD family transcriptional regulator